jgi:phage baseplate assembly protein W
MPRIDYAFPFRIDGASRQGGQAPTYEAHVDQMIRQVLLTTPGERVNVPEFGCGLRRLLFGPNVDPAQPDTDPIAVSTKIIILQSLDRWLGQVIQVQGVTISAGPGGDSDSQFLVRIDYVLRQTQAPSQLTVTVQ